MTDQQQTDALLDAVDKVAERCVLAAMDDDLDGLHALLQAAPEPVMLAFFIAGKAADDRAALADYLRTSEQE